MSHLMDGNSKIQIFFLQLSTSGYFDFTLFSSFSSTIISHGTKEGHLLYLFDPHWMFVGTGWARGVLMFACLYQSQTELKQLSKHLVAGRTSSRVSKMSCRVSRHYSMVKKNLERVASFQFLFSCV